MGIKIKLDKFTYGLGFDVENAYLRIKPITFSIIENKWEFIVKIYVNKESREFERVSEFICSNWGTVDTAPQFPKPEDMDENAWLEVCKFRGSNGQIGGIVTYGRGISPTLLNTKDVSEVNALTSEMYQYLKKDEYKDAEDDITDKSLDTLLKEYAPNLFKYLNTKNK